MKYLFMLMFLSSWAQADQFVTDVGLGAFGSKGDTPVQDKFAKVGIQEDVWFPLKQRFNLGGWSDLRGNGYDSSAFLGYQLGFEVTNQVFQMSVWSGPSVITNPDSALGGPLQFNETVFFGIVDKDKNAIGIAYNHLSSAGIYDPNQGRDYIGMEISFPF